MTGFSLLWQKILRSSIWVKESKETRLVWIAMLALKDKEGMIHSSVIGLADVAKVTVDECEVALEILMSPDEDDSSGVDEGRRIRKIQGGWQVVNNDIYRFSTEAKREFWRQSQAEYRAQKPKEKHEDTSEKAKNEPAGSIKDVLDEWNKSSKLVKCLVISDKRRRFLEIRLRDSFFSDNWREAIKKVSESDFCIGKNERGWRASLDWFIRPDTCAKVMEGNYENSRTNFQGTARPIQPVKGSTAVNGF